MRKHTKIKKNIKAVILAGSRDFGRCPLASCFPLALWPVGGKPVLERLLRNLSRQGVAQAVICSNGDGTLLQKSVTGVNSMQLKFLDEPLPVGTAGCIRGASDGDTDTLFLIFQAQTATPPNVNLLLQAHQRGKADLTVMFASSCEDGEPLDSTSEIYICESKVLEYISEEGYFDIKEGLIPTMLRARANVYAATLSQSIGNFRNRAGYLAVVADYLANSSNVSADFPLARFEDSRDIWVAGSAAIDLSAQIYGPVLIMDQAVVSEGVIIFGPTIVGRNVAIGKNNLIENSVFWDGSSAGRNCEVHNCVVDYDTAVPNSSILDAKALTYRQDGKFKTAARKAIPLVAVKANQMCVAAKPVVNKINATLRSWGPYEQLKRNVPTGLGISILLSVFVWSYWPEFVDLWRIWHRSDEYSSGLLVPLLALHILWVRRSQIAETPTHPSRWGLFAFVAAQALRYFGLFFMYSSAERISIVLSIASLVLFLFGWKILCKVFTVLLFMGLMLPLPRSIHNTVMLPLQSWATSSAVFCLEMMGYAVFREGHVIHLSDVTVAVAEACNGLRMVTAFFIIIGWVVLLVRRAWWEKLALLVSGLPIALLCNTIRLTITAIAFTALVGEKWERIFHDFGGHAMMPLALALVVLELWLLAKVTTTYEKPQPEIIIHKCHNQYG